MDELDLALAKQRIEIEMRLPPTHICGIVAPDPLRKHSHSATE